MSSEITVLVVDDSAFMRKVLTRMLSEEDGIRVVGQARDGLMAIEMVESLHPDVVTMDVEMPGLDGVASLERIMKRNPTPVVMLSSVTKAGADVTVRCLEIGAVDFIAKPSGAISLDIGTVGAELVCKVKAAARIGRSKSHASPALPPSQSTTSRLPRRRPRVVVIGASTGGPAALQRIIPHFPADWSVPVVIVQHMPPVFTASLAERLDSACRLSVREAASGDSLRPGEVLVAAGGRHFTLDSSGSVALSDEPPVHGVRPSVDVTIGSLAKHYADGVVAVLLTGMGRDGARGLRVVFDMGGATIAQDEASCVVYGMPRAAVELEAVGRLLPLDEIGPTIVDTLCGWERSRAA